MSGYQSALAEASLLDDLDLIPESEFIFNGGYTAARLLAQRLDPIFRYLEESLATEPSWKKLGELL